MVLKHGSRGVTVKRLQDKLAQLGFAMNADGMFGSATEAVVRKLQSAFGHDVDGIVGDATQRLIDDQLAYGWNVTAPEAAARALRAQVRSDEVAALAKRRCKETNPGKLVAAAKGARK